METVYLEKLIAGCLKQNRPDQKAMYKAYYGFAMSICQRYAGNRYEAVEIMNTGFLSVFNKIHTYDNSKPFKTWVGCIMRNCSIDYYRSNWKARYNDDIENAENISCTNLCDKKLAYDDLLSVIKQLPNAYRTVFSLYSIEGYTHREIGVMLGIGEGTSKSNFHKAKEKLKKMVVSLYN